MSVILEEGHYFFECPHCQGPVMVAVSEVACAIFRHASFNEPNNPPIPPHTDQATCENLVESGRVRGCAKPFRLVVDAVPPRVEICEYI